MKDSGFGSTNFFDEETKDIVIDPTSAELPSEAETRIYDPAKEKSVEMDVSSNTVISEIPAPPPFANFPVPPPPPKAEELEPEPKPLSPIQALIKEFNPTQIFLDYRREIIIGGVSLILLVVAGQWTISYFAHRKKETAQPSLSIGGELPQLESDKSWQMNLESSWSLFSPAPKTWSDFDESLAKAMKNLDPSE